MTLSVAQMISKIRKDTGIDSADVDDPGILLNLNLSWWELMAKFEFREKEQSDTFLTVAGQILYPAPAPFEAIQGLSVEDPDSKQHTPLRFMEDWEYDQVFVNSASARGTPTRYFRKGTNIGLWPTPDSVLTIYRNSLTTLADLVATAPPVPQEWDEPILFGGIYRSFLDVGDKTSASYFRQQQADMVNTIVPTKSKEEKTSMKWAGLSVPRRWPDDSPNSISGRRIN